MDSKLKRLARAEAELAEREKVILIEIDCLDHPLVMDGSPVSQARAVADWYRKRNLPPIPAHADLIRSAGLRVPRPRPAKEASA